MVRGAFCSLLMTLLVISPSVASRMNTTATSLHIRDDDSFSVLPLMLFRRRSNICHESPAFAFDSAGNLHCIDAAPPEYQYGGYPDWYVHLWTNRSSGRIEHHWIEYYDFDGRYLPLFPNMVSGGVDFIYWQPNRSTMVTEFFQYSWTPTGAVTTQLLATASATEEFSKCGAAWNGTHPAIFYLTSHAPLGVNLSILWPRESTFSFSGVLAEGSCSWHSILDAFLDEEGDLILWVQQNLPEPNQRRILAWCASREAVVCVMNRTITASPPLAMVHSQEGVHWLFTYSFGEVIIYRAYVDPANGNYSLSQEYQQPLITWNGDIHLGLHGMTPFITFLAASPELGSTLPLVYLGSWTNGGEFRSQALNTQYENHDELPQVYDPLGGAPGLIIPYFLRDVTGYDEDLRKDGRAAYAPQEIKENGLDPNQNIDGVYLATNCSELEGLKPALFNLKEAQSSLLPSFWPWLLAIAILGSISGILGYRYIKRRKRTERLIETLGKV